jgi:hypothetical protein
MWAEVFLHTALPAQWAVCQPHHMEVPTQGVVPSKKSRELPVSLYFRHGDDKEEKA